MKVFLRTFGCRANQYDSEQVRALVRGAGGSIVADVADADVAVFNSCAVTLEAEADLRQAVRRASRERPGLRSVVMGCATALAASAPRIAELPGVSDVVAGADVERVAALLGVAPARTSGRQSGARALLRVQDGCDEHCTFCATTIARGPARSRAPDAIVEEARQLADAHPEIVITGVHVGAYGADIGSSLGALVKRLAREVPTARFRLTSVEATEVDARLRELLRAGDGHVAPHLHAPLQSGSDAVLRRMGRHWYGAGDYAAAVERLTDGMPAFALGADVIAGFPGETERDHADTMSLVERLPFTSLHVFVHSPRPGTAAARLGPVVLPDVARRRAAELRAVGAAKAGAYRARRVGGAADVVVQGDAANRTGLTDDYLVVTPDAAMPRGARYRARLSGSPDRLVAVPTSLTADA